MLLRIKPSVGHTNGARYVVESMTPDLLFLISVFGSRKETRLILPGISCTVSKDGFLISGFWRCQFLIRVCFAMTINKAQGQLMPGTLKIDLHGQFSSHGQLYLALSKKTNLSNVSICTTDSTKKTKSVAFTEVFYRRLNFLRDLNVILMENPCNQQAKGNQTDVAEFLNP